MAERGCAKHADADESFDKDSVAGNSEMHASGSVLHPAEK